MKDLKAIIQVRNADVDFKIQLAEPSQGGIDGVASMRVSNCETTRYSFVNCLLSVCLAQRMVSTSSGKTNWTGCRNISCSGAVVRFRPVLGPNLSNLGPDHGSGSATWLNFELDPPERFKMVRFAFRMGSNHQTRIFN